MRAPTMDAAAWALRQATTTLRRVPGSFTLRAARAAGALRDTWSLLLATLAAAALVAGAVALALPGSPSDGVVIDVVQKPVVLAGFGSLVVTALLWTIRRWVLRKRLRDPGPILLAPIEDGTAAERPPVTRLTSYLRLRLSELDLSAPTLVPGRPTTTDFVELLGTTKIDFKQPFALIGRLLRIVLPSHAYEVKATLLQRTAEPRLGVSIEVTVLYRRRTIFRTFWAESWESALDRATTAIGALVVPLSRQSEHGLWSSWRGDVIDEELFDCYQRYQRYSRESRYEEALAALYAALRLDPGNNHIRFQLGLLQEELALYLDALLTYHSIRRGLKEHLEEAPDRRRRHEYRRLELLARYRATILLGWGERLADQWMPAPHGRGHSRRARELAEIRARLRPALLARYERLQIGPGDRVALGFDAGPLRPQIEALLTEEPEAPAGKRRKPPRSAPAKRADSPERIAAVERRQRREATIARRREADRRRLRSARLCLLFGLFALHDIQRFVAEYRDHTVLALGTEITPLALRLLPAYSRVRAHKARRALIRELERRQEPLPETGGAREGCGVALEEGSWPPCPHTVIRLWRDGAGRGQAPERALKRSRGFLDHYNAACTFAVALLQEPSERRADDASVRALARAAVSELEIAVRVAGSKSIAAQWDWILREDPDLAGLRAEPEFQDFESERFPSSRRSPVRPSDIVTLVASRHSAQLFRDSAARLETQWHVRADRAAATDAHEALRWWEEEHEAWRLARELSINHRHWQSRLEVITHTQRYCRRYGLPEFAPAQPAYSDERIDEDRHRIDGAARREILYATDRNGALDGLLRRHRHDDYADAWKRYLLWLDVAGLPLDEETTRRLAVNRASAWADVRIAFERHLEHETDLEAARRSLVAAAARMAELPAPLPGALAATCGRRRILVVADRTLYGENLRAELALRGRNGAELHFVAPVFGLRLSYDASDPAAEVAGARKRLLDILAWAREQGIKATACVGEENAALGAIEDELERSAADEVIVSTLPAERSNWIEAGIVERLRDALGVPVRHIVVDTRLAVTVARTDRLGEVHSLLRTKLKLPMSEPDEHGTFWLALDGWPPAEAEVAVRTILDDKLGGLDDWIAVTPLAPPVAPESNGRPATGLRCRVERLLRAAA